MISVTDQRFVWSVRSVYHHVTVSYLYARLAPKCLGCQGKEFDLYLADRRDTSKALKKGMT